MSGFLNSLCCGFSRPRNRKIHPDVAAPHSRQAPSVINFGATIEQTAPNVNTTMRVSMYLTSHPLKELGSPRQVWSEESIQEEPHSSHPSKACNTMYLQVPATRNTSSTLARSCIPNSPPPAPSGPSLPRRKIFDDTKMPPLSLPPSACFSTTAARKTTIFSFRETTPSHD